MLISEMILYLKFLFDKQEIDLERDCSTCSTLNGTEQRKKVTLFRRELHG